MLSTVVWEASSVSSSGDVDAGCVLSPGRPWPEFPRSIRGWRNMSMVPAGVFARDESPELSHPGLSGSPPETS